MSLPTYMTLEARNTARDHSSKFDCPMTAILYDLSGQGCADDECGESEFGGWYALLGRWIIMVDSQGFVYGDRFPSASAARIDFDRIADEIAAEYSACDHGDHAECDDCECECHADDRALAEYQSEHNGQCDSCEALTINGLYCHETGCPRAGRRR